MRFFIVVVLVVTATASAYVIKRDGALLGSADCERTCLQDTSTGNCAANDFSCLCSSDPYTRAVFQCAETRCDSDAGAAVKDQLNKDCSPEGVIIVRSISTAPPPPFSGPSTAAPVSGLVAPSAVSTTAPQGQVF